MLPDDSRVVGYDLEPNGTSVLAILEPRGIGPGHVSLVLNALANPGGD